MSGPYGARAGREAPDHRDAEVAALRARVKAALALHQPFTDDGVTYCGLDGKDGCGALWPCPTARALGVER